MKGNHNTILTIKKVTQVVINMSKIQNERKSQQLGKSHSLILVVINMSKIQNERKSQRNKRL